MSKKIFQIIVLTTMIVSLGSMNNVMAGFSSDPDMPKKPKCSSKWFEFTCKPPEECQWWVPKDHGYSGKPFCLGKNEAMNASTCRGKNRLTCVGKCTWFDPKKRGISFEKPACLTSTEVQQIMREQVVFPTKKPQ